MKKLLILLCLLAPTLLPAQMGKAYEMNINGVKVIVQPSGNDIVEIRTVIKGGVQNYSNETAGIETLAMTALTECGTTAMDKNTFKNALDAVSAQMGGESGMDYATFRMNCIKSDLRKVWPLYVDALTTPRFEEKEFARIRQDQLTMIRSRNSQPDDDVDRLARRTAFAGTAYAREPIGTEATVSKLTAAAAKAYYKKLLHRGRIAIVVVGDIDRAELESQMKALLDRIPAGPPLHLQKQSFTAAANTFTPVKKDLATNYVQGISAGPQPGSPDYNAFVLAMRIFYTRHFVEIRSNNGLSYAPATWFSGGLTPFSVLFASTTEPNKYVITARQLIDKIRREGFTEDELRNIKTGYLAQVWYRQETNAEQAAALAQNEAVHGNWRRALTIAEDMKKVSLQDLNRVFNKYVTNISWVLQGDPAKADPALFKQKDTPVKTF
ncbi:insulinase family protein [Flaviaesturariibacter flavus]|uniref:Insulinase family protein n=1 Tax=Flaviaesturariibacter flavus TaxID=2502780 RepID=A0A4R1BBY5_9BACT|nr:pitrilysin family protein [Flaviaesturariibacter flavus]TCJ14529.1 insulinase family protein [Flaviaesturariibacter flavus]